MFLRLFLIPSSLFLLLVLFTGCKKTDDPTEPTKQSVDIQFEVISKSSLPNSIDSNLVYIRDYREWNLTSFRDTLRADSLAHYFATSKYSISDFWFPNDGSICGAPFLTENIVYVKLLQPDTTISQLGFNKVQFSFSPCFLEWRHYKYVRK